MYDFYMSEMLDFEDDMCILKMNQEYNRNCLYNHKFIYDYTDKRLQTLRDICNLDSLAGRAVSLQKC